MAAFAVVSGIVGARATGRGMDLDVSLFDTALHNLTYLATWYLNGDHVQGREPRGAHPSLTPSQLYRTRDGWIFIMCNKEKFWPVLAERLGHPEWATDPRFATFRARLENRAVLTGMLDVAFSERGTAEWLEAIGGAVPAAPVLDVGEALDNPFVRMRGGVADFARAEGGAPVRMLTGPVRVDGRLPPTTAAPALGADTDAVLGRLGLDAQAIASLRGKGTIR
jgi:succinate---hydroxymethylglutarate CoA-transferase